MGTVPRRASQQGLQDVGTLWTMRRGDLSARCALLAGPDGWEVCVTIDGMRLLSQRRTRSADAFELAEIWRRRLLDQAWRQAEPGQDPRSLRLP